VLAAIAVAGCTGTPATCNPFYPVPRGATWVYRDSRQNAGVAMQRAVTVEKVEESGRVVTATLQQRVQAVGSPADSGGLATTTVRCAGGAVQVSVSGSAASSASGEKSSASVKAELPGFPPAEKLVAGYTWQSEGRVETTEGGTTLVTSISRESRVDGFGAVKVPAGEFPQALLVASVETLKLGGPAGEREAKQDVREWYVRGLGLVRRDTSISGTQQKLTGQEELVQFSGVAPE
jgi:hypothetical protein